MFKLPLGFQSEAQANNQFETPWLVNSGKMQTVCAIPSEFGGSGGGFSPEDLFLQSLMNCFIGTFKVYAKSSKIDFSKIILNGKLIVDHDESRKVFMKSVDLEIQVYGAERPDRIETIVAKTVRDGFVLNSVKTKIDYKLNVFRSHAD